MQYLLVPVTTTLVVLSIAGNSTCNTTPSTPVCWRLSELYQIPPRLLRHSKGSTQPLVLLSLLQEVASFLCSQNATLVAAARKIARKGHSPAEEKGSCDRGRGIVCTAVPSPFSMTWNNGFLRNQKPFFCLFGTIHETGNGG